MALGLASAIVTAIGAKAANIINKYGNEIGLEAQRGNKFLGMMWGATALMLIAMIAWIVTCFDRRERRLTKVG